MVQSIGQISSANPFNVTLHLCKLENESNWSGWKNIVETYLQQIPNAIKFLNGELTPPTPLTEAEAADQAKKTAFDTSLNNFTILDSRVKLVLLLNLSDSIQTRVRCCHSAKDVWDELINMFEGGSTGL